MAIDYRGKTALITGASSGLGVEFANQLAARGANLILVARRKDRLQAVADAVVLMHKVQVTVMVADLAEVGAAEKLFKSMARKKLCVDVLVNNAGFGTFGEFNNEDIEKISEEIRLNILTLVELTKLALPSMLQNKQGVILNVASTAAYQSIPYMTVYAATKAFVLSFTEALWGELIGTGVNALALSPGGTKTEFFEVASNGKAPDGLGKLQTVEQVIAVAMKALDKSTPPPSVISGASNFALAVSGRFVPRQLLIKIARSMFKSRR
jgi:short-subunit dehydrogenase